MRLARLVLVCPLLACGILGCASAKDDGPMPKAVHEVAAGAATVSGNGKRMIVVVGRGNVQPETASSNAHAAPASVVMP